MILHKDGSSWSLVQQNEALGDIGSVTGSATAKVWLASTKGLLRQQGGGWLTTPLGGLGGSIKLMQLWADSSARLWIVGEVSGATPQSTLISLEGQRWSESRFTSGSTGAIRAIWSDSGCAAWAVGQNGLILRGSRP